MFEDKNSSDIKNIYTTLISNIEFYKENQEMIRADKNHLNLKIVSENIWLTYKLIWKES